MITVDDLTPGSKFVIANQGVCITYHWSVVEVLGVHVEDVRYQHHYPSGKHEPIGDPKMTPLDRFLEIVNAPAKGPHHTSRPVLK